MWVIVMVYAGIALASVDSWPTREECERNIIWPESGMVCAPFEDVPALMEKDAHQ